MRFLLLVAALGLSAVASAQILNVHAFNTSGHPSQAIWTPDGQHVLVTVTRQPVQSGIEVFRVDGRQAQARRLAAARPANPRRASYSSPTPAWSRSASRTPASSSFRSIKSSKATLRPHVLSQGDHSGSSYLAVTPNGNTLFVANEYLHGGSVGVIAIRRDPKGQPVPEAVAQLPTPRATPGITLSPDGTRLYAVDEILAKDLPERLPGHDVPELQHGNCVQAAGDSRQVQRRPLRHRRRQSLRPAHRLQPAARARRHTAPRQRRLLPRPRGRLLRRPHRLRHRARRRHVLVFDAAALERDPEHAFLRSIDTNGQAPVGLGLFDHDRKLLVANSNRFSTAPGNATVIDLADPAKPTFLQTIKTGLFPRNITVSPDGRSLLLTVFLEDQVMLLTMK